MNNRQNGRRRGRGGQQARNGQPGSPDRGNRIDNRARGNAAQLLEKYKNLARDAQMQGDRVNTEYYLQFADHYFRVLSESRSRFEEQRPQRRDDFQNDFGADGDDEQEGARGFEGRDADGQGGWSDGEDERPQQPQRRYERAERGDRNDRAERGDRNERNDRGDRNERQPEAAEATTEEAPQPRAERRPRRERAPRDGQRANGNGYAAQADEGEVSERLEADRLPQGFATIPAAAEGETGEVEAPRPRRPRAPRKPKADPVTVDA